MKKNKMATHMWCGEEKPAHLDNIEEWQLNCGDPIENTIMDAVKSIYSTTYWVPSQEIDENELLPVVKGVMPVLIKEMRDNGIPVWNPEADNYEF